MIIVDTIPSNLSMLLIMVHFYRFSALIMFILIGLSVIWFGLVSYGLSRSTPTYQTPFVEELLKNRSPSTWFPVYGQTSDHEPRYGTTFFSQGTWLIGTPEKNQPLSELLATATFKELILYVELKDTSSASQLKKIIDSENYGDRIIFTSRVDSTVAVLREMSPRWTFANGPLFILRLLTLNSLGLESLIDIPSDVFLIHTDTYEVSTQFQSLVEHARKQNKYVLIGPTTRPMDEITPDGWITKPTE